MAWPVYEDYVLEGELLTPRGAIVGESPLDQPDVLTTEFGKLRDGDLPGLVSFVKRWGLLGAENAPQTEGPLDPDFPPLEQESVHWIWAHARNVGLILETWERFVRKDEKGLGSLLQYIDPQDLDVLPPGWRPRLQLPVPMREHGELELLTVHWAGALETAQAVLATLINPNTPPTRFVLRGRPLAKWPAGEPTPVDTIYQRLADAISDQREVRRCKECQARFLVEDPRQVYCPPLPGSKARVSRCSARVQKRAQRGRKRFRD